MTGLDFSERMLERARRKSAEIEWVQGDALALPFEDASFDAATVGFGVRNVADLERGLAELRRVLGRAGGSRSSRSRGRAARSRRSTALWFDRLVPLLGKVLPGGSAYTYLPASVRRFPGPTSSPALLRGAGFDDVRYRLFAGGIVALHTGVGRMSLATIRETPGPRRVPREPRGAPRGSGRAPPRARRRRSAREALAAGGKRLRPLLVFLASPPGEPPLAAGVAVELVHMATLVHDDLIDRAEFRRGRAAAWASHGPPRRGRPATTSSRARSPSSPRPATRGRRGASPTRRSPSPAARRCSARRRTTPTRASRPTSSAAR